ncbi:hypothetical protein AURDEDRAFT_186874 [Auricularia subglabra TFB-10046 SS5]|nr:hypothetical protein AURDEDRAFT_186874 [Auricularia subglabra TFB-10046 SS5]
MSQPLCTPYISNFVTSSGICASDLVFQTAVIVLNENDEVLMVEDAVAGILSLPRSYAPHSLDKLVEAPLGFLAETGCVVDSLPLCRPERRYNEAPRTRRERRPELVFSKETTTAPFAVALDIAYLPFSNLARIADVRQSIVVWYAGTTRTKLSDIPPKMQGLVHFLSLYEAESIMLNQPLYDTVGVDAIRLFGDMWAATKALPPRFRELKPAPRIPWERHAEDVECYPDSVMHDPIPPVWTPNTTALEGNGFWPLPDIIVHTGAVLFDPARDCVLLIAASGPDSRDTLPRGTSDDIGALLQDPLAHTHIACERLDLPRLDKRYSWVEGKEDPVAVTDVLEETTTNPFMVTLRTHWDVRGATLTKSKGRQGLTYWYGGTFDSSLPLEEPNQVAVPVPEARTRLQKDSHAFSVLNTFLQLYKARQDDIRAATTSDTSI